MFDTMTITKVLGAVCGSLLVLLLGKWAAEALYHTAPVAHAGEEVVQAYVIDTGAEDATEGAAEEGPPFAEILAVADVGAGEKVFAKCKACHTVDQGGANGIGPNLYGVVGKPIGKHAAGFAYSGDLSGHGGNWDFANLDVWLTSPKKFASGTKMSFAGLSKGEDRANIIVYMNSLGSNLPLPAAEAAEAAPAAGAATTTGATSGDAAGAPAPGTAAAAGAVAQPAPAVAAGGDKAVGNTKGE